jgi:hypothetical protein
MSAVHDLAGLGADGGNDAVKFGLQFGIGELVPGQFDRRLRLVAPGLGRPKILKGGIVQRACGGAAGKQVPLPFLRALCLDQHGFSRCKVGLRGLQLVAIVLLVEPRQHLALPDGGADVDAARHHLAGDAEAEFALIARLDLADGPAVIVERSWIDHQRANRLHFRRARRGVVTCSERQHAGKQQHLSAKRHRTSPEDVSNVASMGV